MIAGARRPDEQNYCSFSVDRRLGMRMWSVRVESSAFGEGKDLVVRRYAKLADRAWLATEYAAKARTGLEIASELGCSPTVVYDALARQGIPLRSGGPARRASPILNDAAWLERAHIGEGRSTADIAAEVGCHANTVQRALTRNGIPGRHRGRPASGS
jgi:hypothetical protein